MISQCVRGETYYQQWFVIDGSHAFVGELCQLLRDQTAQITASDDQLKLLVTFDSCFNEDGALMAKRHLMDEARDRNIILKAIG